MQSDLKIGRVSSNPTPEEISAREDLILGSPPRITPLTMDELSDEALKVTGKLRQIGSGRPPPTSKSEIPEIVGVMLRHSDLYSAYIDFGIQLSGRGVLPARERELAVLRTGWLCQAPFEWGEHVKKGRQAGLTSEEIERITVGSSAPGWNERDKALLEAVEEMISNTMISDQTWARLTDFLDDKQMIELPLLIGHYVGVAFSQNSLRIRLNPGNDGLRAR